MTNFSKFISFVALGSLSTAALAAPSAPVTMKHDGVVYTYTAEQKGALRTIRGTSSKDNLPFVLYVSKHSVSGTIEGNAVSFPLKSVKRITGIVEVATR